MTDIGSKPRGQLALITRAESAVRTACAMYENRGKV